MAARAAAYGIVHDLRCSHALHSRLILRRADHASPPAQIRALPPASRAADVHAARAAQGQLRRRHHRRAAGTVWQPRIIWPATTASGTSRCSTRATSAAAIPAATRRSSAPTISRPRACKFYDESVRLWQDLSQDFDLNLFYSTRGHFTLAHTDAAMRTMRWRAEVNKHLGVESEVVDAGRRCRKRCRRWIWTAAAMRPILGALYHAPGAIARHDAVAWGYGRGADRRGVEIHQNTEVLGIELIDTDRPGVTGVRTNRGRIATRKVLCAVAGNTPRILQMVGAALADLRPSAAGHGVRAAQALARSDHRLGIAPRVCEPERARRTGHGRLARPVRAALDALDARLRRGAGGPHAGAVSVPVGRQGRTGNGPAWPT